MTGATAPAQLLDLDAPATDAPGERTGATALGELLRAQAEQIRREGAPNAEVRAELRLLAGALLDTGRPIPLLLGRTLAGGMGELEQLAADPRLDEIDRSLLIGDLRRARGEIPVSTDRLDRSLREALARLGDVATIQAPWSAWSSPAPVGGEAPPTAERSLELLARRLEPGAIEPARRVVELARTAQARTVYAPAGARLEARLARACVWLERPPGWVDDPAQEQGAAGIVAACAQVLEPSTRRVGLDGLDRYAGIAALIDRCDRLDSSNEVKALRASLVARLASPPGVENAEAAGRALDAALIDPVLTLDEDALVRQLRPAWRWAQREAAVGARSVVPWAGAMLDAPSPLTDPATLSTLASVETPGRLGRTLVELSALLDQPVPGSDDPPEAHGARRDVADRVLRMTPELKIDERRPEILATLEQMTSDLRRIEGVVGAHDGADSTGVLVRRVRDALLGAWAEDQGDAGTIRADVERLARLTDWQRVAGLLDALERGEAPVLRWAGVELSPGSVRVLGDDLRRLAGHASAHLSDARRLDRALETLDERFTPVRVLALLNDQLVERFGPAEGSSVLAQIAFGPPPEDAWMVGQRETLARFCALSEELASAVIREDNPGASEIREALHATSERLLRVIEGR